MRRVIAFAAGLLAIIASGPVAATPAACVSPCDVQVTGVGYLPESPVLASGATVRFTTVEETAHPTTDSDDPFGQCFFAPVGYGEPDALVRFDVVGGALTATSAPGSEFESTATCSSAIVTPGGAFVLGYHCKVHPWMRSAFVVEPSL